MSLKDKIEQAKRMAGTLVNILVRQSRPSGVA